MNPGIPDPGFKPELFGYFQNIPVLRLTTKATRG